MNDCIWWADCYSSTLIEGPTQIANVVIELTAFIGPTKALLTPGACVGESATQHLFLAIIVPSLPFCYLFYCYFTNLDPEISYIISRLIVISNPRLTNLPLSKNSNSRMNSLKLEKTSFL